MYFNYFETCYLMVRFLNEIFAKKFKSIYLNKGKTGKVLAGIPFPRDSLGNGNFVRPTGTGREFFTFFLREFTVKMA